MLWNKLRVSSRSKLFHTASATLDLNKLRVVRMPSLSPTIKSAKLLKLHITEGQLVSPYDLCFEVLAKGLTSQSTTDESWMEIEVIEDMYVAKMLCIPGEVLEVDSPIALLCENKEDIQNIHSLRSLTGIHSAIWQAYVKTRSDPGSCGCS